MKRITIFSTLTTLLAICLITVVFTFEDCDVCFTPNAMMTKFVISGLVLFFGGIYFSRLYLKTEHAIHNIEALPLLDTDEAVSDLPFSGEGVIECEKKELLVSPYTQSSCVYYHSITEELRRSGKKRKWMTIENVVNFSPFYISDRRGKLKIDLTNLDNDFSGHLLGDTIKSNLGPNARFSELDSIPLLKNDTHGIVRKSEYVLMPGTQVFVFGFIYKKPDELILKEHLQFPLIISRKTKEKYIEEFYKGRNLVFFSHILMALGFSVSFYSLNYFLKLPFILFSLFFYTGNIFILGSIVFTTYNRLLVFKQRAMGALSNIDVELKRRADLLPQLVDVVKKYNKHEKYLFEKIAGLRSDVIFQKTQPDPKISNLLLLHAVEEKYPQLKASVNFGKLMNSITDSEERIAYSRTIYNRNVSKLNILITQFPFILVALFMNVKPLEYLNLASNKPS